MNLPKITNQLVSMLKRQRNKKNRLKNFVIHAQIRVDLRERSTYWPEQHAQSDVDILQVLGPRDGRDVAWPRAAVEDDRRLNDGNDEMRSFAGDVVLDAGESIEDNGAVTAVHVV